jgi:CubicO group peptidase (beta-lactamase class C family)
MTVDSAFYIASCTKLITSIAVMQCIERGLLKLDQDVVTILPEWKDVQILKGFDEITGEPILVPAVQKLTLRYDFFEPVWTR